MSMRLGWKKDSKRHKLVSHGVKSRRGVNVVAYVSPHCSACHRVEPSLNKLQRGGVKVKRIDVTKSRNTHNNIRYTPTIDVYNNNQLVERIVGYSPDIEEKLATLTNTPSMKKSLSLKSERENSRVKRNEDIQKTGCIGCSISHLATVSGSLNEAIRFARSGGINHPEVVRRLNIALEEITVMERIDLSPDAVSNSPKREQALIHEFQPKIRQLRQHISEVKDFNDLEQVSIEARTLSEEMFKENLQL